MRTISFIFAFAFAILFLGPSIAGTSDLNGMPGIGTFEFSGSTVHNAAPVMIAAIR